MGTSRRWIDVDNKTSQFGLKESEVVTLLVKHDPSLPDSAFSLALDWDLAEELRLPVSGLSGFQESWLLSPIIAGRVVKKLRP